MDIVGLAEPVVVRDTVVVRVARGDAVPVTEGACDCDEVSEGEAVVEGLAEEEEVSEAVGERVGAALTLREGDHESEGEAVAVREAEGEAEAEDVAEDESVARTEMTVLLAVMLGVRLEVLERVGRLVMSVRVAVPDTETVCERVGLLEREGVEEPVPEADAVGDGVDEG
jgi:hypothetical protein